MTDTRPTIYLAGPEVFAEDPSPIAAEKKAICDNYGFRGIFPMDNEMNLGDLPKLEQARAIFGVNIETIRRCDLVIANMNPFRGPSMDVGTAMEIGFAYALGKPVIGYRDRPEVTYPAWVRFVFGELHMDEKEDGSFIVDTQLGLPTDDLRAVEDFDLPDNLMVCLPSIIAVGEILPDFESAVRRARTMWNSR